MAHECSCRHDSPIALDTPGTAVRAEQTVADVAEHRAAAAGVPLDALLAALNEPRKTPA